MMGKTLITMPKGESLTLLEGLLGCVCICLSAFVCVRVHILVG